MITEAKLRHCRNFDYRLVQPVGLSVYPVPIVFLPGMASGSQFMLPLMKIFARLGYRCFSPDLPGHGRSRIPVNHLFGTEDYVKYLECFIEKAVRVDGKNPDIIGHSMGGPLALLLAEHGYANRTVAVTPASFHEAPGWSKSNMALEFLHTTIQGMFHVLDLESYMKKRLENIFVNKDSIKLFLRLIRNGRMWESYRVLGELIYETISVDRSLIKTPVLVIGAGKDVLVPPEVAKKIVEYLGPENAKLHFEDGFGHMAPIESPKGIAKIILDQWMLAHLSQQKHPHSPRGYAKRQQQVVLA